MSIVRLVLRERKGGVLVSLGQVLSRLDVIHVDYWALRDVEGFQGSPWSISLVDFERLTRELRGGLCLASSDLRDLGDSGLQIVNGDFEALVFAAQAPESRVFADLGPSDGCLLRLRCIDGGQWEVETSFPFIAAALEKAGFQRDRVVPP